MSFFIWYDLDVVVPWVVLFALLTPWFMAGNRIFPDCLFFRRPHVSVVRSLFDIKLRSVNIGSFKGVGVVRRDGGSLQFT